MVKDLIQYIAQSLVDHPEEVQVSQVERDSITVYELRVASEDMGRVIGKQGRIAKALRMITKAAAIKNGTRVHVEILE